MIEVYCFQISQPDQASNLAFRRYPKKAPTGSLSGILAHKVDAGSGRRGETASQQSDDRWLTATGWILSAFPGNRAKARFSRRLLARSPFVW